MLDICPGNDRKGIDTDASILNSFKDISLMVRYKRDCGSVCKSLDAMDKKGQRAIINANQRKKGIETASTSPASNSINTDYSSAFHWNNSTTVVTELKDVKGDIKSAAWSNQAWNNSQSDLTSTNSGTNCSVDEGVHSMRKRSSEVQYNKSGTSEGAFKDGFAENMAGSIGSDRFFLMGRRSSSFSGGASYPYGSPEQTVTVVPPSTGTATMPTPSEGGLSYAPTQTDGREVVGQYIMDLSRKRLANATYPEEGSSYTNNKFAYKPGPFGFRTIFRDTECMEVVRSTSSTAALTVFTAFSPSQLEENTIPVDAGDKVDIVARLNRWIYVKIAMSANQEAIGRSGWIPEHVLLEPEIFTRQLHHPRLHTHTFNKFI